MRKKINFRNGDIYEGELNEQEQFHGIGTYSLQNGSYYLGQFFNNQFHGEGQFFDSKTKTTINGQFKENEANGQCVIEYSDLTKYEGSVQGYKKSGKGKILFPPQNRELISYDGEFSNDQFHGRGRLKFRNLNEYDGMFVHGKIEGRGVLKNAQYVFEGNFQDNKKSGKGILKYSNKDEYSGEFLNDTMNGQGGIKYADGTSYEGGFLEGKKHGRGVIRYANGDVFEGAFRNGLFDNFGKYTFQQQNAVYEGSFVNGYAEGQGKILHLDTANVYEGKFVANAKNGPCKFYLKKDGKQIAIYNGEFSHNIEKFGKADYGPRI